MAGIAALSLTLAALAAAAPSAAATEFPASPAPQPVPTTPAADGPSLAVGLQGQTIAVWRRNTGSQLVVDSAVRPLGGPWTALPDVVSGTGGEPPRVEIDGIGRATLFARVDGFRVASLPPGGTWSAPQSVDLFPETRRGFDAAGGRVLVADVEQDEDPAAEITVRASLRPSEGAAFEAIEEVAGPFVGSTANFSPAAAALAGQRGAVAWIDDDDELEVAVRGPGDTGFGTPTAVDTTASEKGAPMLVPAPDGDLHVVYWEQVVGGWELHTRLLRASSSTFGAQETAATRSGAPQPVDDPPVMTIDGDLVLFYRDGSDLRSVARLRAGGYAPSQLVSSGLSGGDVATTAGPDGTLAAVFARGAGLVPTAALRSPDGVWAPPVDLGPEGAIEPAVAIGLTGDAVAAWTTLDFRILASIGDSGEAPSLALSTPLSFRFGQPISVSLTATDFSGIASSGFGFSDGATAGGTSATHTFAPATPYRVTAAATDGVGNVATTSRDLTLQIDPICACAPPSPPPPRPRRTRQPDANVDRIRSPIRSRALRELSGTASDELGLSGVEVSLVRTSGGARFTAAGAARRCFTLRADGRVTRTAIRRGLCRAAVFHRATGTTRWRYRLKRRLPRGSYVLVARARAADGTVERGFSVADRNLVRFRVR